MPTAPTGSGWEPMMEKGTGSAAKVSIKPAGFGGQVQGNARGHLLGNQLGGSGSGRLNIYQTILNRR